MKQGNYFIYLLYFVLFIILQIIFFRNIVLFNYAMCFIYVGFIILLPINISPIQLMLAAFCTGIFIDSFYDTVGINAFTCVFLAYIRPNIINILTPRGGYDNNTEFTISSMGIIWFIKYAAVLLFIHHFIFFSIEAWNISFLITILIKSISSTAFTLSILIILQYLFSRTDQ